jgi:hypothetical protein
MKHVILGLMAAVVLAVPTGFAASKMICKDTGKEVTSCCCPVKEGKFVCKFTQKTHDTCCCGSKSS